MLMTFAAVVLIAALFVSVDAWKVSAQGSGNNPPCGGYGYGSMHGSGNMMGHMGMMSDWNDCNGSQMGPIMGRTHMGGMMGGWNNQQGWTSQNGYTFMGGYGMMGGWTPPAELAPTGTALTLDEARAIAEAYIAVQNNTNLTLGEVTQIGNHFYAQAVEGQAVFEFLIDAATGNVYPANMMWNAGWGGWH
jgi:hypothetical protein